MLSPQDSSQLISFLYDLNQCSTYQQLDLLFVSLDKIFQFDFCYFCLSRLDVGDRFVPDSIQLYGSWPEDWYSIYMENRYYLQDPIILNNFRKNGFGEQHWKSIIKQYPESRNIFFQATEFGIKLNSISISIVDPFNKPFGGVLCAINIEEHERTYSIIRFITSYIYFCALQIRIEEKKSTLTHQERQFLDLFGNGMTRKHIAEEYEISLRRVGQVLTQAAVKLDAHNTAHSINEAKIEGIIGRT